MAQNTPSPAALYQHKPLHHETKEIRLVQVSKDDNAQITCSIRTFDLEECPKYFAVSYVWGPPTELRSILVNGCALQIRRNLYEFLQDYSAITGTQEDWLWMDQICIDQSNANEKNHQVRLMSQIYSKAKKVVVWLNDDDEKCTKAARTWNKCFQRRYGWNRLLAKPGRDHLTLLKCFGILFQNGYFTRLWILQEILLAEEISLLVKGCVQVSWWEMVQLYRYFVEENEIYPGPKLIGTKLMRYAKTGIGIKNDHNKSLIFVINDEYMRFVIHEFCNSNCEDPRDKVYGLIGIVSISSGTVNMQVDYRKPIPEVYRDTALRFQEIYVLASSTWKIEEPYSYSFKKFLARQRYHKTLQKLGKNMGISQELIQSAKDMIQ